MRWDEQHRSRISEAVKKNRDIRRQQEIEFGKVCPDCKTKKPIEEFGAPNKSGHFPSVCKSCKRIRFQAWAKTESGIASQKSRYQRSYTKERSKVRQKVTTEKSKSGWYEQLIVRRLDKCSVCGYDKNVGALDLHHVNPEEKEFNLSAVYARAYKSEYGAELDKCICLCANCHREAHAPHKQHTMREYLESACKQHQKYLEETNGKVEEP
jgi:endogenous inhibitor of DNA gyrase (YacG/DUF329 family)